MNLRDEPSSRRRIIWAAASFHLPFPLGLISNPQLADWESFGRSLLVELKARGNIQPVVCNLGDFVNFPGGSPLICKDDKLLEEIPLAQRMAEADLIPSPDSVSLDHEIWLCHHGLVLINLRIELPGDFGFSTDQLDLVVQSLYSKLALAYLSLAKRIIPACLQLFRNPPIILSEKASAGLQQIIATVGQPVDSVSLLEDLVEDVYYIDCQSHEKDVSVEIDYFQSTIKCPAELLAEYIIIILTSFVSFREMLWMLDFLSEKIKQMQLVLFDAGESRRDAVAAIRLIRLTCLKFINESSPISIRLTREFMECTESCWAEFRISKLASQIDSKIVTLVEIADWFEDAKKESRNFKIGLIGVLFATLSFISVAIGLTDMVYPRVADYGKLLYVAAGGAFGVGLGLLILLSPTAFWHRARIHRKAKWDQALRLIK